MKNNGATISAVDRIRLEGMVFSGRHGFSDAERARSQRFTVDIEVETSVKRAGRSDRIADTVDYRTLRGIAKEVITGESAHLIEALAERIARRALDVSGVKAVSVRVAKQPASMRPIAAAAVQIRRTRP
jgi:7,8-dihydroneopterin aldolase/epimerase/oxygenase